MKRSNSMFISRLKLICAIVVLYLFFAGRSGLMAGETPPPSPPIAQPAKDESKPISPQDMEKMCVDFARLRDQRADLELKKERVLEDITGAKARLDVEASPVRRNFTRREIDRLATQWHELIEKSQGIEDQQRDLLKQMLQSKEQFQEYLRKTAASLRTQIGPSNASPEQPDQRFPRLQKRLERMELVLDLLTRLKDRPELLTDILTAPPEPGPRFEPPPPGELRPPREMPGPLRLRVMRLEKEIQSLRARLERYERELEAIKNALETGGEKPDSLQGPRSR